MQLHPEAERPVEACESRSEDRQTTLSSVGMWKVVRWSPEQCVHWRKGKYSEFVQRLQSGELSGIEFDDVLLSDAMREGIVLCRDHLPRDEDGRISPIIVVQNRLEMIDGGTLHIFLGNERMILALDDTCIPPGEKVTFLPGDLGTADEMNPSMEQNAECLQKSETIEISSSASWTIRSSIAYVGRNMRSLMAMRIFSSNEALENDAA